MNGPQDNSSASEVNNKTESFSKLDSAYSADPAQGFYQVPKHLLRFFLSNKFSIPVSTLLLFIYERSIGFHMTSAVLLTENILKESGIGGKQRLYEAVKFLTKKGLISVDKIGYGENRYALNPTAFGGEGLIIGKIVPSPKNLIKPDAKVTKKRTKKVTQAEVQVTDSCGLSKGEQVTETRYLHEVKQATSNENVLPTSNENVLPLVTETRYLSGNSVTFPSATTAPFVRYGALLNNSLNKGENKNRSPLNPPSVVLVSSDSPDFGIVKEKPIDQKRRQMIEDFWFAEIKGKAWGEDRYKQDWIQKIEGLLDLDPESEVEIFRLCRWMVITQTDLYNRPIEISPFGLMKPENWNGVKYRIHEKTAEHRLKKQKEKEEADKKLTFKKEDYDRMVAAKEQRETRATPTQIREILEKAGIVPTPPEAVPEPDLPKNDAIPKNYQATYGSTYEEQKAALLAQGEWKDAVQTHEDVPQYVQEEIPIPEYPPFNPDEPGAYDGEFEFD